MKKKIFFGILSIFLVLLFGGAVYFVLTSRDAKPSEALQAVPTDAAVVIKSGSLVQLASGLAEQNTLWMSLDGFPIVKRINDFCVFVKEQIEKHPVLVPFFSNNEAIISVHLVGKDAPTALFIIRIPPDSKANDINSWIDATTGNRYNVDSKEYNGAKISTFTLKGSDPAKSFSFSTHQGLIIYSSSLLLVESAIGQLTSGLSLLSDKAFVLALNNAGTRVPLSVLVNHKRFPHTFSSLINKEYREGFSWLAGTAQWSELDLTIKDDTYSLNGFTQVSDSLSGFYKVFAKQKPVKMTVTSVLPSQTAAFIFLGISNLEGYLSSLKSFLDAEGKGTRYEQKLKTIGKEFGTNIEQLYASFFGKELALAFIPFEGECYDDCWYIISEVQSQSFARKEMQSAIEVFARQNGQALSSFEKNFSVDREKSVKIYKLPKRGLHEALFGSMFGAANDKYFTFIDSYIVFGSSVEALSRLVLANVHNKQLNVDQRFSDFSLTLASESNFLAYVSPARAETLYGQILEPSWAAGILSRMESVQKIQGLAMQLTGGKNMIFNNFSIKYSPVAIDAPQTVWETRIDTSFFCKPQLITNHNTQGREIFVQDTQNRIYLINEVGRVLWKRPINDRIMGEVHQIDLFRNGRLQLLFNTRNQLYIVDRNGNDVIGYPVTLRSPATNPVAVFDYDRNRDYRFFIAGEDKRLQVYNNRGNIVQGWSFDRTEKVVRQPVQHFRAAGKDFIVLSDENRIYLLDRRGKERIKPSEFFAKATNSSITLDNTSGAPHFVTTDSLGVVRKISLDGKVTEAAFRRASPNHFFDVQDVNADGKNDYIFLDGNELWVLKNDGKELFSLKFKTAIEPQVIYFYFGANDRKLGVYSAETEQIYLINSDGSFYKGFPLRGITPFSIGRFASHKSSFNLIVGSSSGYLLNYAVQ